MKQDNGSFRREVEVSPAFDKRSDDPKTNYGIHGAEIRFLLHGEKGTIQFLIYTGWQLKHVADEMWTRPGYPSERFLVEPSGADVGYHSPVAMYEGQGVIQTNCPYLGGKPCYYDGSGLRAEEWLKKLIEGGTEWMWPAMEQDYRDRFESEERS